MSLSLFAGWRPDAAGRLQLQRLANEISRPRPECATLLQPRRPDQWRITLCVVGHDVAHLVTPELLRALADAGSSIPAHEFRIERLTYWPASGAVVALPYRCQELQALCDATQSALRRCGIRPMRAAHQPHITLAYLDLHQPLQAWLDDVDCSGAPLLVTNLELLFNPGGHYQALACWPLTGGAMPPTSSQSTSF